VNSRSNQLAIRLGTIAAMVAMTCFGGCGRKAGLDPPPVASVSAPLEGAPLQADPTQPQPAPAQPRIEPMFGPDGKPIAPKTGEKRWTPLDWLLN
jgi:hypothetical protein